MISYIVQETLGNVVNLEFNCSFRLETRKGAHQGGGCWVPISNEKAYVLRNNKYVCSQGKHSN